VIGIEIDIHGKEGRKFYLAVVLCPRAYCCKCSVIFGMPVVPLVKKYNNLSVVFELMHCNKGIF
jgi:hypothetical protein